MNASTAASSLGICSTAAAVRSGSSVATEMVSRCTSNPEMDAALVCDTARRV